ncbi:hypothetical protein KC222_04105 [Cedecea davisae]|uniref:SGNH hydrolase-type esterase domain-containing protein n=1 Tax=Cedecea davisae TaxID=158484 RepID=A0ABS6DEJ9_9ENTR|nr:GDSL-type esterase/lipase family protein [Cedecea davisae]MBU4681195.1 hypothetical protein [Cedecea davisae]MBU4685072.1 hypothetical protein [Cedecea davisae]
MTVSTEVDHNEYTGNGVTVSFPYTFRIFLKSDLVVQTVDLSENIRVLALDTDYTVTGAGKYNGGAVVLTAPLANGWRISVSRELPVTQETDLRNQGKFFAEVHEDAFDKLTMLIQQCFSGFGLALRRPSFVANFYDALGYYIRNLRDPSRPQDAATKNYVDSVAGANLSRTLRTPEPIFSLPPAEQRKNKIVGMNNDGQPVMLLPESGSAADVMLELASSADGKGDELSRVKQPFAGSNSTTVHQKMREIVAINDGSSSGAEPDGVTDCFGALMGLVATGSPVIRFPSIPGTANIYYFSSFEVDNLQGCTFDVDPGVTLSLPNGFIVAKPSAKNIKFVRATKLFFRDIKVEYEFSSGNNESYVEKKTFLEASDFDKSLVFNIDVTKDTKPMKISWPGSDTWVDDNYSVSGADFGQFYQPTGDGFYHIGFVDILPEEELSAAFYVTNELQLSAIVRHTDGYSGIYATTTQTGAVIQSFEKRVGQPAVIRNVLFPMLQDHDSYSPVNAEWKIRVNSFNSFDILFNGMIVVSMHPTGFITSAGFGAHLPADVTDPTVRFFNPVKMKGNTYTRNGFISTYIFGDSISASRGDSWDIFYKKEMEFAEGARAFNIVNYAVLGDTSAGQLEIMKRVGVAGANVVIIAVGTNDAQGLVDVAQYKNNLSQMMDICQAAGVLVILVKFGLWYSQALRGNGSGQNTGNYQYAARYRSVVARLAAERSVKFVDLSELEGPLVAYYVNPDLELNLVGRGPGVVSDAIHPDTPATQLIGRRIAKAVMGGFAVVRGKAINGMSAIKPANNWAINPADRPVFMDVSSDGVVSLAGIVFRGSASSASGTVIMKVPSNMAPARYMEFPVAGSATGLRLVVTQLGEIIIYGATNETSYVSVAGISWVLK